MPPENDGSQTGSPSTTADVKGKGAPKTATSKGAGTDAPTPAGGPRAAASPEAMSAFERAKARRGQGAASDSVAAGLSSGKTAIQKSRGLDPAKSALEGLKERSRKHNPNAKVVESTIEADDAALPDNGASREAARVAREEEPEVEPLAPAPGEEEIPAEALEPEGSTVSTPVGDHTPGEGVEPLEEVAPAEGEFTPNLKYRAFGQEHDIPERFRGLITDEESQKEVHNVFERAHAFDRFKTNLTQLDETVKTKMVPEIQFHRQTREQFNQLIQKGDIFGILGKMNIPREKVLQAVADRLRIEQLPPEQRAMFDAREREQAINEQAASQIQTLQAKTQHLEALAKNSEIQSTFARGDVRSVSEDFDAKMGQPGAFEQAVRDHGALMYSQGKDLSPLDAVRAVMQKYGLTYTAKPAATTAAPAAAATTKVVARPATRTIPNIAARAATTTRSKPLVNNVADIKKLRAQMRG